MKSARPFLMFQGDAAAALEFYATLFDDFEIHDRSDGSAEKDAPPAPVLVSLAGQEFMVFDSPVSHDFGFTPATSIFLECDDEAEIEHVYAALSDSGGIMMPLDTYDFSRKFAWVSDRFGLSWQINLA